MTLLLHQTFPHTHTQNQFQSNNLPGLGFSFSPTSGFISSWNGEEIKILNHCTATKREKSMEKTSQM